MAGYAIITNIDKVQQPYNNYLWALLNGYNRKASEVSDWTKTIIAIPNTPYFGLEINEAGEYTIFRKEKINGKVAYTNILIDCSISQNIVFTVGQILPPIDGFLFRVAVQLIELGDNQLNEIEYGYSLIENEAITNWQDLNTFDLSEQGVYYFDVRVKNQELTVGKHAIELFEIESDLTGGDISDNPFYGNNSSED